MNDVVVLHSQIKKIKMNPYHIFLYIQNLGLMDWMDDENYIKYRYMGYIGKRPDLSNPRTFNEKLQWLKLHDRRRAYTSLVDKYAVKEYVARKIGEKYVIPTIGAWDKFEDIDFDKLPLSFVLKCTHDSGGQVIVPDKSKINKKVVRNKIYHSLKRNYYKIGREYPYKNVKPKIIAEQYMLDSSTNELRDYKFFCFNGVVKCFKIDFDRFIEHHANYYDVEKKLLDFGEASYPPVPSRELMFPETLLEMKMLAERLSEGIPFLRVDFYDVDGKVYFGELTFYPAGGFGKLTSDEWDIKLGNWIKLPESGDIDGKRKSNHSSMA